MCIVLYDCDAVSGFWALKQSGELSWSQKVGAPSTEQCLHITPGVVNADRSGDKKTDPQAASIGFQHCVAEGKLPAPTAVFALSADGKLAVNGSCIGVGSAPGVQLW